MSELDGVSGMVKYWDRTGLWDRLYRRNVWETLRLPEGRICEDRAVFVQLHYGRRMVRVCEELYFYRTRASSVVHSKYSVRILDWFWAQEERIRELEKCTFAQRDMLLESEVKQYCRCLEIHYHRVLRELKLPCEAEQLKRKLKLTIHKYRKVFAFPWDEFTECYRLLYPVSTKVYCYGKAAVGKLRKLLKL